MLLFDDSKKLEKALGEEAAAVIVHVFEKADDKWRAELATRSDLLVTKTDLQREISAVRVEISAVRVEMHSMKHDIPRWMVGGFIAQAALLIAVLAFLK
ncbi:MAG: hypothetical protein LBH65_00340 [Desulfovibrio sp.]|jgi:hypothetical protein|nr:hypothetical protein [Desulfovibrio sp.]